MVIPISTVVNLNPTCSLHYDLFCYNFQEEKTKGKVSNYLPNVVMLGLTPSEFVLRAISNVKTNDLEQALLVGCFLLEIKPFLLGGIQGFMLINALSFAIICSLYHSQML